MIATAVTRSPLFCSQALPKFPQGRPRSRSQVVLVHGAFVDGSGWQAVYDILTKDGYEVPVVQTRRSVSKATSQRRIV
jgi:hypothetical protein